MSDRPLSRELQYFIDHQDELVESYGGRVIVIEGDRVIGVFDTVSEAVRETAKEHELGTFMVQRCEPGSACYTAKYQGYRASFDPA